MLNHSKHFDLDIASVCKKNALQIYAQKNH